MACGARLGLKHLFSATATLKVLRRNGLWSPFGIETLKFSIQLCSVTMAKWPVEPVWD